MINLAGYKILKEIGSGGMGVVYLAEHEKLKRKVAIKSLHKNLVNDTNFRKRFSNEAITHSKLDHPNIVKLLDFQEKDDGLFLIMEYVDGIQLDNHIKKVSGPISENELTSIFSKILSAIGYAHNHGLVHRDIKPSNIMISKDGNIKLLDFGIAKSNDEDKGLTMTGVQIGTAAYMSPEQVGAKKLDHLSDIYSLGVTLFYMAVGKSPYDGDTNTFDIQNKIVNDPLPKASKIYPGVSTKIEEVIKKATHKKKKSRYQSCDDFASALTSEYKVENEEVLETKTKTSLLSRFIYPICILFFVLLYFVTATIDNNTDQPNYFLSEYSLITALFVLVSIFSFRTFFIKRKIKKIIFREVIYLISGVAIAFIMFNIHSNIFYTQDKILDDIYTIKDQYNKTEKLSYNNYNENELINLGFSPLNNVSYYSDFIYTLQENLKTNSQGIKYFESYVYNKLYSIENGKYLDQLGDLTLLSTLTDNSSNQIYFEINNINYDLNLNRNFYVIGDLKLLKKKGKFNKVKRTFFVGGSETSMREVKNELRKYISGQDIYDSKNFGGNYKVYKNTIGGADHYTSDGYGLCYWDKKEKLLVRSSKKNKYEKKTYGTTGLGCETYLCVSKKTGDDYFYKYIPSTADLLTAPSLIEKEEYNQIDISSDLYNEVNYITLKKDTKGIINLKLDKIEASLYSTVTPYFFEYPYLGKADRGDWRYATKVDWGFLFLVYAYIFRAIISILAFLLIWYKRIN